MPLTTSPGHPQMKLGLNFDTSGLKKKLDAATKNLAYSTAQALNETAKEAQIEEREHVHRVFTIRNPQFIDRLIKIGAFANVKANRPFVEIFVDQRPLKNQVLLPTFESSGTKLPHFGKNIAIPITGNVARPSFSETIPQQYRIPALRFRPATRLSRQQAFSRRVIADLGGRLPQDGRIWKGRLGTYLIPNVGIFQRVGRDVKMIYVFKKSAHLDARLQFGTTVKKTFERVYQDNFERIFLLKSRSVPG